MYGLATGMTHRTSITWVGKTRDKRDKNPLGPLTILEMGHLPP